EHVTVAGEILVARAAAAADRGREADAGIELIEDGVVAALRDHDDVRVDAARGDGADQRIHVGLHLRGLERHAVGVVDGDDEIGGQLLEAGLGLALAALERRPALTGTARTGSAGAAARIEDPSAAPLARGGGGGPPASGSATDLIGSRAAGGGQQENGGSSEDELGTTKHGEPHVQVKRWIEGAPIAHWRTMYN